MTARHQSPAVKVAAPDRVTQGDRYKVRMKWKAISQFRRADIQQRVPDVFGDVSWQSIKTVGVKNRRTLTYRAVAGEADRETYRVILKPKSGRAVKSKPVSVDVWHWYPIVSFESYYSTQGIISSPYIQFSMAGRSYSGGWSTYSTAGTWEARYTLGRNCQTMSGTFGVTDKSQDGSSATIQVLAEGVTPVYASPTLSPGVVDSATVQLPSPYRVSILGTNTSPEKVTAYPAAGDLQFLCTGLN